mmetsp:Transcript_24449/g.56968  ORF Transcript_24449/g.56968 Transcript_24449/m.56968 type:complete len:88 (-) Transcript_24449:132-395(-)
MRGSLPQVTVRFGNATKKRCGQHANQSNAISCLLPLTIRVPGGRACSGYRGGNMETRLPKLDPSWNPDLSLSPQLGAIISFIIAAMF